MIKLSKHSLITKAGFLQTRANLQYVCTQGFCSVLLFTYLQCKKAKFRMVVLTQLELSVAAVFIFYLLILGCSSNRMYL